MEPHDSTPDDSDRRQNDEHSETHPSRRRLLQGTGVAVGAGVLGFSGSAAAQSDEAPDPEDDEEIVAYALTLERLQDEFYEWGIDTFSREDLRDASLFTTLQDADVLGDNEGRAFGTAEQFAHAVAAHEAAHVEELEALLEELGGDPDDGPEFTFEFETVDEFLAAARVLENTAVAAYAGVAPDVEDGDVLSAALSIHSVEARHAAFLNGLNQRSPFPNAFDEAMSPDEVHDVVEPYLANGW